MEPLPAQSISFELPAAKAARGEEPPRRARALGRATPKYTFSMDTRGAPVVRDVLLANDFEEMHPSMPGCNVVWQSSRLTSTAAMLLAHHTRINHFPRSSELTRKDWMVRNLRKLQKRCRDAAISSWLPPTYVLPEEAAQLAKAHAARRRPWIVKPAAASQGRGVYLVARPSQIDRSAAATVVSEYLAKPLLLDGRKFDLRLYVAVTSYNPVRIYLHRGGLARFSSCPYDATTAGLEKPNPYAHLTNYSINKFSASAAATASSDSNTSRAGLKRSLADVLNELERRGKDTRVLMRKIEAIIVRTIASVELPIATACSSLLKNRDNCAELYGFDVLIDENLCPWLIEVNLSPSLSADSPLDQRIKTHVATGFLNLMAVPAVDPEGIRRDRTTDISKKHGSSNPQEIARGILRLVSQEQSVANTWGWERLWPSALPSSRDAYAHLFHDVSGLNAALLSSIHEESHDWDDLECSPYSHDPTLSSHGPRGMPSAQSDQSIGKVSTGSSNSTTGKLIIAHSLRLKHHTAVDSILAQLEQRRVERERRMQAVLPLRSRGNP